jgi:hypothetical protein
VGASTSSNPMGVTGIAYHWKLYKVRPLYEPGYVIPSVDNCTEENSCVRKSEFPTGARIPEVRGRISK